MREDNPYKTVLMRSNEGKREWHIYHAYTEDQVNYLKAKAKKDNLLLVSVLDYAPYYGKETHPGWRINV